MKLSYFRDLMSDAHSKFCPSLGRFKLPEISSTISPVNRHCHTGCYKSAKWLTQLLTKPLLPAGNSHTSLPGVCSNPAVGSDGKFSKLCSNRHETRGQENPLY